MTRRVLALFPAALAVVLLSQPMAAGGPVGMTFVPIPGCRAVDTRGADAPALGPDEVRVFTATGKCGIPASALGLAVNLTVVNPAAIGFAVIFAGDGTPPTTSDLSFNPGKTRSSFAITAMASDASGTVALANGSTGPAHYLIDVIGYFIRACTATITVGNPATATGTVNAPFSQTFTSAGGIGAMTYTTASPLPAGLTLAANGTLSGTPTQPGSFPIAVTATDANGCTGTGSTYTLVIACQTVSVTNPGVTTGTANVPFSQTFTQTGGSGTTTFSTASALPIGMTLAANGVLSGTPTQAGGFDIVVVATDANGCTGTGATYHLVIGCQTIGVTNPVVASGTAGASFSQTFTQTGAIGGATFSLASGVLPAGLTLAANGLLSGTPVAVGSFSITVKVTDGNLCTGTGATYTLVIGCQGISVTNPGVATGTAGTAFSQTFTQVGAIGSATFTTASTLPAGLTLAANGVLSGTPTVTGTFPIVVTVTDANGCTGSSATYTLVVACQTYTVNPASVPQGTSGVAYPVVTFTHTGGIGAVAFAETGTLPIGMQFHPGTGTLDGTPTQSGSFPITVTATDANGCTAHRDYLLVVVCSGSSITLSPASLPSVTVGNAFPSTVFSASGGTGPYTFAKAGVLPAGMNFNAGTATLDGTPTETGSFPITISATDTVGLCVGSQDYVINVTCNGVTITVAPPSLAPAPAGAPYGPVTFTASGGTSPYTFTETGALPTGMTFAAGVLSGTPTLSGTFSVTVTARDANGCVGSTTYSLVITCPVITVTNPGVATGTVATPFSQTFLQSGGALPITFSLASGTLPTGVTLSSAGVLSGTPTQSGSFPITVKATDANGCTGTGPTYTLVISCQTITVNNPATNSGADGAPFLQTFTQTGGIGATTFSLASGVLPSGWTLTSAGVLANAAPTPVSFSITVRATDSNGCTGTGATYTVSILPAAANDTYVPAIVGNMSIDTATGTTFSVLSNDSAGTTAALFTPAAHGTVVLSPSGAFTYAPDRGYEGPDSFQYKATHTASGLVSSAATVNLTVTGVVWFVNDNPGACVSSCDGRRTNPYTTLAAFQAANDGTGTNPKVNHRIFLYESNPPNPYVGPVTLLNGQRLIGQDFSGTFATAVALAVPDTTVGVPVMDPFNGSITEVTNGVSANAINLVTDNSVIGLRASASSGRAISQALAPPAVGAASLGTTILSEVTIQTTSVGTALAVFSTTGTLSYPTGSINANGSNSVSAVFIQGGASAITIGAPITSTGAGNISISQRAAGASTIFNGPVLMTGAATGIAIGGLSGAGTIAFNAPVQLGTGPGSRMTGAGGIALDVNHSGTASTTSFATLSLFTNNMTGVNAQTNGVLNFATASLDVTNGRALSATSIALGMTFSSITQASGSGGSAAISITSTSGSLTSVTTSISSASQEGISITGASGNLNFGGTTVAGAGAQGILINGSSATIGFSPTTISGTGAQGIRVAGSTSNVSFGNTTITGGTQAIALQGNSSGTRSFGTLALTGPFLGLLNDLGGGNTTVAGAATITNPAVGVQVDGLSSGQAINFNSTLSIVNAGGTGVLIGTVLTNAATATLNLGTLSVSTSSGTAILAGSASTSTPLTTSGAGLVTATSGPAINATNTTFNASFGSVSSTNSTTQGITLTGALGTLTMNGGSITGAAGTAFNLSGGTANVTYAGTITQNAAQFAVAAASMTGGTKTFSGNVTSTTSGKGISLTTNTGATIAFTGGLNLSTGTFPAFTATGGGTVTTTQNNTSIVNTLATTTGTALNVANTTIGAAGLTFHSISSNGGSSNGIILDTTGASGGLTITGDGANTSVGGNASGGTIANKSGADGSTTQGTGIFLKSTKSVVLRRVTINGTNANFGIRGFQVDGFTLEYSTVGGTNGTSNNAFPDDSGEGSVYFGNTSTNGISTQGTFTNNNISGGAWDNVHIENTTAGTTTITVKGNTFGLNGTTNGNQSFIVEARNAGTIVNSVVGGPAAGEANTFMGAPGGLANFTGQTGTTMDVQFKNNVMTNGHPNNNVGGGCLTLASQGVMTFVVDSNSMRDADGSTMTLQKASLGTSFTGRVTNNTLGVTGVLKSASKSGNGIFLSAAGAGTIGLTITNNQIRNWGGNAAMFFDNTGGSYTANFTIQSNVMAEPGAGSFSTLAITNGGNLTSDTVNVCATIGGAGGLKNTMTGAAGLADVYLGSSGQNGGHTFNLPGYVGPSNLANVQTFVTGNNTLSGGATVIAYDDNGGPGSFTGVGGSCPTP